MLKRAILFREQINREMSRVCDDPRCRFYTFRYWDMNVTIDNDNWSRHQFASVDKNDNVMGYISSNVDQKAHFISQISMIRFMDNKYTAFALDIKNFFLLMFNDYKYRKACFTLLVGSPHEKMYDRFMEKYGGRVVGIFKEHTALPNGQICDEKSYEIFRQPFLSHILGMEL